MKVLSNLERIIHFLTKIFQWVAMFLLFFMMAITVVDVIGRYFSSPLKGTFEMTNYALALIVFLGLAYAQRENAHITVDIIVEKFPTFMQNIINILWYLIMFIVLNTMGWQMFQYALRNLGSASAELKLPISVIFITASIGVFLYAVMAFVGLIKAVYKVVQTRVS